MTWTLSGRFATIHDLGRERWTDDVGVHWLDALHVYVTYAVGHVIIPKRSPKPEAHLVHRKDEIAWPIGTFEVQPDLVWCNPEQGAPTMKNHSGGIEKEHVSLIWLVLLMALVGVSIFYLGETFRSPPLSVSDYHGHGVPL
jgi:hypothetical protein